jgi:hypothetical protein
MIALIIIPLKWADPDSRKVLIPDESRPSDRLAGDGSGFYSVVQALHKWGVYSKFSLPYSGLVTPSDLPLYGVASPFTGLVGVYIEHFSAPADYDNHFVETPLIAVPVHPSPQQSLRGAE